MKKTLYCQNTANSETHTVIDITESNGVYCVEQDQQQVSFKVLHHSNNQLVLLNPETQAVFQVKIVAQHSQHGQQQLQLLINGEAYNPVISSKNPALMAQQALHQATVFQPNVTAPMPGKIINIQATVGQHVKAGETLVVMESMKMELSITAASDAVVKTINITPTQLVTMGDVLVTLAESS